MLKMAASVFGAAFFVSAFQTFFLDTFHTVQKKECRKGLRHSRIFLSRFLEREVVCGGAAEIRLRSGRSGNGCCCVRSGRLSRLLSGSCT